MHQLRTNKSVWAALAGIILLALFLRAGFFAKKMYDFKLYGDALNYHFMARQLVEDGIYGYALGRKSGAPNAYITPGYPLFLSAVYAVVTDPYFKITAVRAIQVVVGALSCGLAFLFIRRFLKHDGIALLTALLMAVYPPYIQSPWQILTEVWSLATMLLYFWLTTVGLETRKAGYNFAAGLVFAVHVLIRPVMLPLIAVPYIYALLTWYKNDWRALIKAGLQTAAGLVLLMLPWWIRNYIVLNQMIITATGSANPLLAGTYPYMKDLFKDFLAQGYKSQDQGWYARKRIIEGFTRQPLLYLKWYTFGKTGFMFETPWLYQQLHQAPLIYKGNLIFQKVLNWSGFIGLVAGLFVHPVMRFITIYSALFLSLYLIFIPMNRYAYQLMFFVMLGTAFLIYYIYQKLAGIIFGGFDARKN